MPFAAALTSAGSCSSPNISSNNTASPRHALYATTLQGPALSFLIPGCVGNMPQTVAERFELLCASSEIHFTQHDCKLHESAAREANRNAESIVERENLVETYQMWEKAGNAHQ
jgi:hypothetical protein